MDDLFKKVILPRITLHNGKGKLSTEEACQRIRKLNIVAHWHGGYTALKLEEKMQEAMTLIGYNNDERKKIQSQLLVVAHAPACALGVSKSQFVSFKSVYDSDTPLKNNFFDRYIESRKAEERRRFVAEEDQDIDKIEQNDNPSAEWNIGVRSLISKILDSISKNVQENKDLWDILNDNIGNYLKDENDFFDAFQKVLDQIQPIDNTVNNTDKINKAKNFFSSVLT